MGISHMVGQVTTQYPSVSTFTGLLKTRDFLPSRILLGVVFLSFLVFNVPQTSHAQTLDQAILGQLGTDCLGLSYSGGKCHPEFNLSNSIRGQFHNRWRNRISTIVRSDRSEPTRDATRK
jgi:hypothetical protein